MIGGESAHNPLIVEAARGLMDAGDTALRQAALALSPARPAPRENTALSP